MAVGRLRSRSGPDLGDGRENIGHGLQLYLPRHDEHSGAGQRSHRHPGSNVTIGCCTNPMKTSEFGNRAGGRGQVAPSAERCQAMRVILLMSMPSRCASTEAIASWTWGADRWISRSSPLRQCSTK